MIQYEEQTLQLIEEEIIDIYQSDVTDYTQSEFLLDLRKRILNEQALTREAQEELLPDIIAFNDALHDALKHMFDRAHELYRQISAIQPDIMLTAKCYLAYDYPALHPYQKEDRQDLYDAICDFGWNKLYESGVTLELELPRDINIPSVLSEVWTAHRLTGMKNLIPNSRRIFISIVPSTISLTTLNLLSQLLSSAEISSLSIAQLARKNY